MADSFDAEKVAEEIMEAQADLQVALGWYRLDPGSTPQKRKQIDERLLKVLARLHALLDALGHPMYQPATHPDVPARAVLDGAYKRIAEKMDTLALTSEKGRSWRDLFVELRHWLADHS